MSNLSKRAQKALVWSLLVSTAALAMWMGYALSTNEKMSADKGSVTKKMYTMDQWSLLELKTHPEEFTLKPNSNTSESIHVTIEKNLAWESLDWYWNLNTDTSRNWPEKYPTIKTGGTSLDEPEVWVISPITETSAETKTVVALANKEHFIVVNYVCPLKPSSTCSLTAAELKDYALTVSKEVLD